MDIAGWKNYKVGFGKFLVMMDVYYLYRGDGLSVPTSVKKHQLHALNIRSLLYVNYTPNNSVNFLNSMSKFFSIL